jgi:hypothetical protein
MLCSFSSPAAALLSSCWYVEDTVEDPKHLIHLPLCLAAPRKHLQQPRGREEVAEVKDRRELGDLLQRLEDRSSVGQQQPVAQHGAHGRGGDELGDQVAHVDDDLTRWGGRQRRDETGRLVLPDAPVRVDASWAQQLRHDDPAEQLPVLAVGSQGEAQPAPVHLVEAWAARPLLKGGAVVSEDLPRDLRGGDDQDHVLADPEPHQRPVPTAEIPDGAERGTTKQVVQAADDDWQLPRSRRQNGAGVVLAAENDMDD